MQKYVSANKQEWVLLGTIALMLLLPTLYHVWWFREDIFSFLLTGAIVVFTFAGALLCIPWRTVRWAVFTLLFVVSLFELAHMLVYNGDLSSAGYVRSLFMTTPYEADGAVGRIIMQHIVFISLLLVFYILISIQIFVTRPTTKTTLWVSVGSGALLFALLICCYNKVIYRPPLNIYTQMIEAVHQCKERNNLVNEEDVFNYNAHRTEYKSDKEVYLLIMDESLRYDHVSLDGEKYRLTMPHMGKQKNLIMYSNYYTAGVFTMYAVPMLVTRATPSDFVRSYSESGVQQAYAEVGFKTVWLTNEAQLVSDGVSDYIARGAEIVRIKRDMDVPAAVDSLCCEYEKLFIIVHLWGNHQYYLNTNSAISLYFPDVSTCSAVHGEEMYNNAYDNAILYTDSMLFALTDVLLKQGGISQWIFTSDHGEGPIGRNGGAHGFSSPYESEYHVPLIVWYNDGYAEAYPNKMANVFKHKDEPVCADHIFWSVLDLAGIRIDSTLQQDGMSIFGDTLPPHRRTLLLPDGKGVIGLDSM